MLTIEREQRLFPDITFTCNGSITKWIVGAGDIDRGERYNSEVQVWRKGERNEYDKIGSSLLIVNESTTHLNVHEYIPNPPLEFQEGDILGVFQPDNGDNLLQLYYQENTGPLNYFTTYGNTVPSPVSFELNAPATQLYYPLVSVVVSTSGNN